MAQHKVFLVNGLGGRFDQCREDALRLLRKRADNWAKGDPENPSTEETLDELLAIFEKWKFLKRPFNSY